MAKVPHKTDLSERLLEFSARVIKLIQEIPSGRPAGKIADQLVRSAMSTGANYEEARGADSRPDFCHKLQISLKEMREARYWLCLIAKSRLLNPNRLESVIDEATQLRAILAKSVATARGKAKP